MQVRPPQDPALPRSLLLALCTWACVGLLYLFTAVDARHSPWWQNVLIWAVGVVTMLSGVLALIALRLAWREWRARPQAARRGLIALVAFSAVLLLCGYGWALWRLWPMMRWQ